MNKAKSQSLGNVLHSTGSNRIETSRTPESPALVYLHSKKDGAGAAGDAQFPMPYPWASKHQHEVLGPGSPSSSHKVQGDQQESSTFSSMIGLGVLQKTSTTYNDSTGKVGWSHNSDHVSSNPKESQFNRSRLHYNELPVTSIKKSLQGGTSFRLSNQPLIGLAKSMELPSYEERSSSNERNFVVDLRDAQSPPPSSKVVADHNIPSSPDKRASFFVHVSKLGRRSSNPSPVKNAKVLDIGTPTKGSKEGSNAVGLGLSWQKRKRHQRAKSLEMPAAYTSSSMSTLESHDRPQGTSENMEDAKPNTYSSFVKDLMDLNFDKLQIPSLAKPSPTSFLTGHDSEVLRTCEYEAAPFQMEIPSLSEFLVTSKLTEFVENYRRLDQNFDLQHWKCMSNKELQQVKVVEHIPIAQLLIDCGEDVSIQGVVEKGSNADSRIEAVIFEGQQNFVVVLRGTTELQAKPNPKKSTSRKAVSIDAEHENVEVYKFFLDEYTKIEKDCFALLDTLIEEHPFCDVTFTGHSFGGALSILAALRYSNARPMVRVNSYPMGSPKVGFSEFRRLVNSSPNLRVMRLEFGQDGKCLLPGQGGSHVGHTLVLHGALGNNSMKVTEPVLAFKFEAPKHKKFKTTYPDLRSYVVALEEIARLKLQWATDFVGTSGQGVVINNETRQVV